MTKNTKNTTRQGHEKGQLAALRRELRRILGDGAGDTVFATVGLAIEEYASIDERIKERRDKENAARQKIARAIAKYDAFLAELKKAPAAFQQAASPETVVRLRAELRAAAPNANGRPHDEIRWMLLDGITSGFDRAQLPLTKGRTGPLANTIKAVLSAVGDYVPGDIFRLVALAVARRIEARPTEQKRQTAEWLPDDLVEGVKTPAENALT